MQNTVPWSLSLVTAATEDVVALDAVKLAIRVDATTEDDLIDALNTAATEYVEQYTDRALRTQTWDLKLDCFPCSGSIYLPKPPVTSITSVTYVDTNGQTQTWSSANYLTDLPTGPHAQRARITPAYGVLYPLTQAIPNAVTVRFVSGYTTVPQGIVAAIKLVVGHWYANREPVAVPQGIESLLWPFKAF